MDDNHDDNDNKHEYNDEDDNYDYNATDPNQHIDDNNLMEQFGGKQDDIDLLKEEEDLISSTTKKKHLNLEVENMHSNIIEKDNVEEEVITSSKKYSVENIKKTTIRKVEQDDDDY